MEPPMFVPSKRARAPNNSSQLASCMVDGCNSDLSKCREYHRRHKVCELHSKTPKVTIRGEEQRFCQQCSRFHYLVEFDDAKRSCRKRLDGHNRRRRKPQPDTSSQNSTSQFFSNSNYEVAKFVPSGSPQAFLSSGLGSSCSWASPVDKTMSNHHHHHQTASMRSFGDKKVPSFPYGGPSSGLFKSAQIQFPFLQDGSSTRQQEHPLIANHPNHQQQHQQAAPFLGTAVSSTDRALSLLSSLPPQQAAPESSCSQKLLPSRAPSLFEPSSLLPTQLQLSASDATTSNASVLVSQGMMFQIARYDDDSESSSASGSRPLHHHATSFSWD